MSSKAKTKRRKRSEYKYTSSDARLRQIQRLRLLLGYGSSREVIDRAVDLLAGISSHVDASGTVTVVTPDQRQLLLVVGCPAPYDNIPHDARTLGSSPCEECMEEDDDDDGDDAGQVDLMDLMAIRKSVSDKDSR